MVRSARTETNVIPLIYRVFFLYIEPLASLVGAYYAFFLPQAYLHLTDASSSLNITTPIPLSTSITLLQLSNLYFLFAINEAFVLRVTSDIKVWQTLLFGLLVADLGHLWSVHPLGVDVYWKVLRWNAIDWGNVGFVYLGAGMRMCFLAGFGMRNRPAKGRSKRRVKR